MSSHPTTPSQTGAVRWRCASSPTATGSSTNPSQGLSDYVATACALAGFRPRKAVLTSQVQAAVRLAAAGLGAVLVPSANVPEHLAHTARTLDPPVAWELTVFARSALSAPAAAFVELLSSGPTPSLPAHAVVLPGG